MGIRSQTCFLLVLLLLIGIIPCNAKIRWSSLHSVPDADLLDENDIVIDVNNYYYSDSTDGEVFNPAAILVYSPNQWVNFDVGYSGGVTLGFKARILNETNKWLPSLAFGIQNCITNQETYYYDIDDDSYTNELYIALAKSIESIRLRIHAGILSIPDNKQERFNPYLGLEKYFGGGVYTTFELHRRDHTAIPSLFASWRFAKSHLELSAGVVSFVDLLLDEDNKFDAGIVSSKADGLTRPGVYFGLRFHGNIGKIGKSEGSVTIEERVNAQESMIDTLRYQLDSLKNIVQNSKQQIKNVDSSLAAISDSTLKSKERYRTIVIDKLNSLRVFYSQDPFEPELVKSGYDEIVGYRNEIVPTLFNIAFDLGLDKKIRTLAVSVLGHIGTGKAMDALIDILSQSKEPDVKIEALISLGNNKETRAIYLMQQLANDPNDALAFTAAEVLKKIESQTGTESLIKDTVQTISTTIPETKIGDQNPVQNDKLTNIPDTTAPKDVKNIGNKTPVIAPTSNKEEKSLNPKK